jgi:hypothetical protein
LNGRRNLNWVTIISRLLVVSGAIDIVVGLVAAGVGGAAAPATLVGNRVLVGLTVLAWGICCIGVSYGFRLLRAWAWTPTTYLSALNLMAAWVAIVWPGLTLLGIVLAAVSISILVAMFVSGVAAAFRSTRR